ncbi:PHT4 [Symbiodinium sp. KB8]|nr:PHT4 [Symbiodinium sp. KB8]
MRQIDSIAKNYAFSASIFVTAGMTSVVLRQQPPWQFHLGALISVVSMALYARAGAKAPPDGKKSDGVQYSWRVEALVLASSQSAYSAFLQSLFPFDNPPPPLKLSMSRLRLVSPLHRRLLRRLAAFVCATCFVHLLQDAFAPAPLPSPSSSASSEPERKRLSCRQFAPSDAEVGTDPGQDGWEAVVFLCALGIMISYADRSNISIAIIGMAKDFQWDKAFEGTVLSAFFGGYAATQLLGGRLADVLGTKWVLAAGLSTWSLATALTPLAAAAGAGPLLAVRLALGLGEGVAFPAVHAAIARLVPRSQCPVPSEGGGNIGLFLRALGV